MLLTFDKFCHASEALCIWSAWRVSVGVAKAMSNERDAAYKPRNGPLSGRSSARLWAVLLVAHVGLPTPRSSRP